MTGWEKFFSDKIKLIFNEKKSVLDIGGGLRISREKGNRYNPANRWIAELAEKVDYKILDPVPDYRPDVIGDIHHLPFPDNSQEAIICLAVLEHVADPLKAAGEIHRTLRPGGYALVYLPFIYYYHAERGYYRDYWRFSADAVELLFKNFSELKKINVRGAIGTWLKISPLGRCGALNQLANFLDRLTGKLNSRQTSGYYVFLVK